MRTGIAAVLGCAAVVFAAGCGSSSGSSSSSSTGPSQVVSGAGATSPASSEGIKVATTPKYGTPSSSASVQSGVVQVAYRNIAISPDTLRVKVGSTIKWTNYDSVEHNVTSEGGPQAFASKDFGEGGTFEIKATKPGVIHYQCTIHPASMNGTIEVVK
ncbi:MAG TPA: plastocyanin/azurin family copper-binding protein [Solirubrobacteraceae bacterium]|nr:plastocyanin/azurin family copper-binding protein [Solirubrobacteraceae bacterium]